MSDFPKIIGWAVWYDDGTMLTSKETTWESLPDDGVIEIVLYKSDGSRRIMDAHDWYFRAPNRYLPGWEDGWIYGHDTYTTKEEIQRRYPGASIKRGRWVSEERMHEFSNRALAFKWE